MAGIPARLKTLDGRVSKNCQNPSEGSPSGQRRATRATAGVPIQPLVQHLRLTRTP
jgi:hypothetical protein